MYPGYLNVGCQEIVNNERAAAYSASAGLTGGGDDACTASSVVPIQCDRCEDLPFALGHDPYTNPMNDDAPWYDPVRPVSQDFLGVMGGSVEGISGSTVERDPVDLVSGGSAIGPLMRPGREMAWTVTAIARSECALSYGISWLSRALAGDLCQGSCSGQEMIMFACCPSDIPVEEFEDETRRFFDVGIMEGPTVTERTYMAGDIIWATVTFTLVAGNPWIYGDPLDTGDDWVQLSEGEPVRKDPDQVFQQCVPPPPCAADPNCPEPLLPPRAPMPVSPCYQRGVGDFLVSRTRVAAEEYPLWSELVPTVEVVAGSEDLRRILIRFWANPVNAECTGDMLDPCDACGDINISYVPAGARLLVDGRTRRSVIECRDRFGQVSTSDPNIFGPEGGLFQYPFFPCPGGLCIEVWVSSGSVASDAQAQVLLVPRTDVM